MAAMRATPKKFIKTLFVSSIMCFAVVNLNLFLRTGVAKEYNSESINKVASKDVLPAQDQPQLQLQGLFNLSSIPRFLNNSSPLIVAPNRSTSNNIQLILPPQRQTDSRLLLPLIANHSRDDIKLLVRQANHQQRILNLDKYELGASDSTVVIVVQVHNRVDYLHPLIDSLRKARDIENTLLIFSHDFFSDEINQVISTIDFCLVMQIFYPFAIQIHPTEFPGESPKDCPRDIKQGEAIKRNCVNAKYPDKYGHYREAKYCQTKHHWFWKLSHVFDHMNVTSSFTGPMLFIEEDHYMVEDFIPVLRKMYRLKEKSCPDCSIFTIGSYEKKPAYGPLASRVDITNWVSSKHNMGMSFNKEVWVKIKSCAQAFCAFDDYNWDWSLHNIGMTCIPNKLKVMVSKSPRIYHIGECGVHHKGKNCDPAQKVHQIEQLLSQNKQWLFPTALTVAGYPRAPARMPKPNGGWGDLRDHQLCLSFLQSDAHR